MSNSKPPRLEKDKKGNYYVLFHRNKRSARESLRTNDSQKAHARFAGWLENHAIDVTIEADPLVSQCLSLWFDQWIKGQMASEVRYPSVIRNLNCYFGQMCCGEIVRNDSREYARLRREGTISGRMNYGAADSTIRRELQSLRAAFRFMVERVEPKERRISKAVVPYVQLPPASPPRDRVLDQDELDALKVFCTNHIDSGAGVKRTNRMSRISRFIWLAMETAQRKSAICELMWEQVDFELGLIFFNPYGRQQTTKRRPPLPISSSLLPILKQAYEERVSDYVLDNPSGSIDYAMDKVSSALKIDGLTAHVFRHTWATRKVMAGVPIAKVAAFLGDNEETVSKNYIHLSPDYLRDVAG